MSFSSQKPLVEQIQTECVMMHSDWERSGVSLPKEFKVQDDRR